jgi:hypothetical protein
MKTYKVRFHGYGVEVIVGSCSEKMFNHFKENDLDVTDYMCGNMDDELSEEIHEGLTMKTKYDNDRIYHNFGAYLNNNTTMVVVDENDKEVYSTPLDFGFRKTDKWSIECEQEINFDETEERFIIVGQEYSKGLQAEYLLPLKDDEEFDSSKICILNEEVDEMIEIITGLRYNEADLECTGEVSTVGKSACWFIRDTETNKETYW